MAPPRTHDHALRRRLLDLAGELLAEHGEDAVTLRRVAAAADTSTTAVYALFGDKAGLLTAVHREAVRGFGATLDEVATTDDPVRDIVAIGLAYRAYALAHPHRFAIMFDRRFGKPDDAELAREADATFATLRGAIDRAQRAGRLRDAPADQIALSCWGAAHGLVELELSGRLPGELTLALDALDTTLTALLDGWAPR